MLNCKKSRIHRYILCIHRCNSMRSGSCNHHNYHYWHPTNKCRDTWRNTMSCTSRNSIRNWCRTTDGKRRYTNRNSVWKSPRTNRSRILYKQRSNCCIPNWRSTNHSRCRSMKWNRGRRSRYSLHFLL